MNELTLKKLYNTEFSQLYHKLLRGEALSEVEWETILTLGLYFTGRENKNIQSLGYRLFLLYSKMTGDYKPLYEVSLFKGLIPVAEFINQKLAYAEKYGNIYTNINNIINISFKTNDLYMTLEQKKLKNHVDDLKLNSEVIVAPTSYGKTELILSLLQEEQFKKVCIISPTKSLLMQTKKRVINHFEDRKIITFPEMYKESDEDFIAILTQERLLRLLQNNSELTFDLLVVDEAHNLLERFSLAENRSVILASVIIICNNRNNKLVSKYLSPFLKSKDSLKFRKTDLNLSWYSVSENIKSEIFYFYDLKSNKTFILDQYAPQRNAFVDNGYSETNCDVDVVTHNCDKKNILYLNRPRDLEKIAGELAEKIFDLDSEILEKAAIDLREYIHDEYKLADYISKGIIYHHGSIPEPVRYFVEDLYTKVEEVKFLIANATLLEGVNIPATKLFILDPRKGGGNLSPSAFKNLVGRICRFSEIFDKEQGDLKYLLPEIFIIKGAYCRKDFNFENFVKKAKLFIEACESIQDVIKNPLLKGAIVEEEDIRKAEEILENISTSDIITRTYKKKAKTKIGELCFANNVRIFNILESEEALSEQVKAIDRAENLEDVFKSMDLLFFSKIDSSIQNYSNLNRLQEVKAQRFYIMLIKWRIMGLKMQEMVNNVVGYWDRLNADDAKTVYVGKWGDVERGGKKKYWTNIREKSDFEKINLAIVRLKEEYDFIDNEIIKYIEVLNALGLIDKKLYLKIKYGTDNEDKISLLNCGITSVLSQILEEKYKNFFKVDLEKSRVIFSEGLIEEMVKNRENGILVSEVRMNSKD